VNDDEFLHLQNSSKNVELDEMLHQPSEKRSSVSKTVFVKGRQDLLEDVVALLANVMVLGRFWVKFMETDVSTYPYVLRQLVGLADVLASAKFRAFAATMKGVCPYLAHTLIVNIFNIFNGFVELAKNPHVIREIKATGKIDTKHVKVPLLIVHQLLEQLHLCIATGSTDILFTRPPQTLLPFFPLFLLLAGTVFGRLCRLRFERETERTVGGMKMVFGIITVAVEVTMGTTRESVKVGKVTLVTVTVVGIAVEERGDPVVLVIAKG